MAKKPTTKAKPATRVAAMKAQDVKDLTAKKFVEKLRTFAKESRPVEWVRIHKLSGFVYFPHKRHVQTGLACQQCHGEVQTMTEVAQVAPLTMGWCVSCHAERKGPLDCVMCHH